MREAAVAPPRIAGALLLTLLLALSCSFRCDAQGVLPQREVDALRQIATKLKIPTTLWDFSLNPCNWTTTWCDCNASTKVCQVVEILFWPQNLTGELPKEFGNLTSLTGIDLSRNYISGSIPAADWASLPLLFILLRGNRLSGPIPDAIGKISTLQTLVLDNNMLQGPLPPSLGNLANLSTLVLDNNMLEGPLPPSLGNLTNLSTLRLSANYFTGELPETLGNLRNLLDFRIDGNDISGKIPSFIGNWTKLQRFDMQGTSLEGPFPTIFSTLQSITALRVSDLKNTDGSFPFLRDMINMTYLILRNCSISGEIPFYIDKMDRLKTLDLSFNNLTGELPVYFDELRRMENIYLTSNALSDVIPSWILISKKNWDISYNNFTVSTSEPTPNNCQLGDKNIIASVSSTQNVSVPNCLRKDLPCSQNATNDNFFINCGGARVTVNNVEYEEDTSLQGTSTYFLSGSGKWAYSSTGDFVDNPQAKYIAQNTSMLTMPNPELYMTARLNPLSLKYFGLCMQKGNYTVQLHFAEIMFTDDQTFRSNGRRVFDVSIQGIKVLKDFNIAHEANGTGKEIIKNFTTSVEGSTLEIHFRWAGKGTNAIPNRGVYGSLISAISVTPNFKPDLGEKKSKKTLPVGAIVGIVTASCALVILVSIFLWFLLRRRDVENSELKGLELQTGYFTLRQIKAATKNFDPAYKIGEGGFGPVYKGVLPDGSAIAVKQLSSKSKQGNREFVNEIGMISALQHPHLVKLFGCCIEENQLLLIYEYMENNCLARALFGPEDVKLKLDWKTRHRICLGIARGLAYLHEESRLKIVHRDIKATNILLDKDLNAKISDFGLAKLDEEDNTHISTRVAGTWGYMAPEYATRGYLTDKADVYSFGVVILEIVSGKNNTNFRPKEDLVNLLDWAHVLQEQGSLLELVDPSLGTDYSKEEAQQMLYLALLCTSPTHTVRPPMSMVVCMLEGQVPVIVPPMEHIRQANHEMRFPSFEMVSYDSQKGVSMDRPGVDSSTSMQSSKGDVAFHSATSKLLYTEEH